jgi:hypothetical protein
MMETLRLEGFQDFKVRGRERYDFQVAEFG